MAFFSRETFGDFVISGVLCIKIAASVILASVVSRDESRGSRLKRRDSRLARNETRLSGSAFLFMKRNKSRAGVLTIYMENPDIPVGKSYGTHHSIWNTSKIMGFWSK